MCLPTLLSSLLFSLLSIFCTTFLSCFLACIVACFLAWFISEVTINFFVVAVLAKNGDFYGIKFCSLNYYMWFLFESTIFKVISD